MAHRRPALLALALVLAVPLAAGCGDDEGSDAASTTAAGTDGPASNGATGGEGDGSGAAAPGGSVDIADAIGGEDLTETLDSVGLETKAGALESAIGDDVDRIEVQGDTVHIYLRDDATFDAMMGCMVTGAILSDGESAVFHEDGDETPCE